MDAMLLVDIVVCLVIFNNNHSIYYVLCECFTLIKIIYKSINLQTLFKNIQNICKTYTCQILVQKLSKHFANIHLSNLCKNITNTWKLKLFSLGSYGMYLINHFAYPYCIFHIMSLSYSLHNFLFYT